MSTFEVGGVSARPGEKKTGRFKISERPDGSDISFSFTIVHGSKPGPTLLLTGGTHGDEVESILGVVRFTKQLDPNNMSGTIISVPVLNSYAFEAWSRGNPLERYHFDLNRCYPGRPNGSLTEMIAHNYLTEFVPRASFLIDAHGGGNTTYIGIPYAIYQGNSEADIDFAKGMGPEWSFIGPASPSKGTLAGAALEKGITSMTLELGGSTNRMPQPYDENVGRFVRGLENLAKHLNMIEGRAEYPKSWTVIERNEPRIKNGGLIELEPQCKLGERVKMGTPLLRILNLYGEITEVVTAPIDGVVLAIPGQPVAYPGEPMGMLYRIIGTIS